MGMRCNTCYSQGSNKKSYWDVNNYEKKKCKKIK